MLRLASRRRWLVEIDYVWPTWRVGISNTNSFATNTHGEIGVKPSRSIAASTMTAATNFLSPTTTQIQQTSLILQAGGASVRLTDDLGLQVYVIDSSFTVISQTFAGPLLNRDTVYAIRLEVDRGVDVIRVYLDNVQVGSDVDISTLGDFHTNFSKGQDKIKAFTSLFVHVEGIQGWDRLLAPAELPLLNTPTPPEGILVWCEVIVPVSERYTNELSNTETEAQFINLLKNSTETFLASINSADNTYVATPSSVTGPYQLFYSMGGFASQPTDTPANRPYSDRMLDVPIITQINEAMVYGVTTERINGVVLRNDDGVLDFLRWVTVLDQSCTLRFGDPAWALDDFIAIRGKCLGINIEHDRVNLALGGLTSLLEHRANISDTVPICIGNISGAKPGPNFTWRGEPNAGITLANLVVVRDRGASIGFTDDGDGTFTLNVAQLGEITYATNGWKGDDLPDSDQTYGIDGVLKQFLLHHSQLDESEIFIPNSATLQYPDYLIENYTSVKAATGGVFVAAGSEETVFEVAAELGRSALSTVSGVTGAIAMHSAVFGVDSSQIRGLTAKKIESVAIRRNRDGVLDINYARNPNPLSDVAGDPSGSASSRRGYFGLSSYGGETDVVGTYPFAPYREVFSAPWLRSFSGVDGQEEHLELRYQQTLQESFAQEMGLWQIDLDFLPQNITPGSSHRIFAPEFPPEGAVCHVTGRAFGDDNYLLVLTNGH